MAATAPLDVSTMSLKSIIKCAYAKERARLEEEKRRKVTLAASHILIYTGPRIITLFSAAYCPL